MPGKNEARTYVVASAQSKLVYYSAHSGIESQSSGSSTSMSQDHDLAYFGLTESGSPVRKSLVLGQRLLVWAEY